MLSRIKLLALLVFLMDLVLLGVMVHYTSWLFMLGFVFISCLLGGWVLNDGLRQYVRQSEKAMEANQLSGGVFLLGAASRLAAGALLIVPGVLTDILALILLSPVGKRLSRIFIVSLISKTFPQFSQQKFDFDFTNKPPAKDEIIDVQVKSADELTSENRE
jgi:UPF0716 protein FxsA